MPEEADKQEAAGKPVVGTPAAAGKREEVDKSVEAGMPEEADKMVEVDKSVEEGSGMRVVAAGFEVERLPLKECRRRRKNGHFHRGVDRNWCRSAFLETSFTSLACIFVAGSLWHIV